jgi:hypothetical protein
MCAVDHICMLSIQILLFQFLKKKKIAFQDFIYNILFHIKETMGKKKFFSFLRRDELTMGYFDNLDNGFLKKYKKILKIEKIFIDVLLYL